MLDLLHPSLFCYVKGVSRLLSTNAPEAWKEEPRQFRPYNPPTDFFARPLTNSQYQWMPTPFRIEVDGKATALSYISGLAAKAEVPELYGAVEDLLARFIPFFEKCLTELYEGRKDAGQRNPVLRNRTIQVITKAINYILPPGQDHEGVWHVEGKCGMREQQ